MSKPFLKCDAEDCDHTELVSEISESLIGKQCPKCGANLLTKEDFEMYQPLMAAKSLLQDLGFLAADSSSPNTDKTARVSVHCHNGEYTIKEVD